MRDSQANGKKPIKEAEKLRAQKPKLERVVSNSTERKKAEEALRKSEQELKIRNRINNIFLTIPDEKMYAEVLNLILEVMESKLGKFGYFKEDGAFVVPAMTREIFWDKCNVPQKEKIFERGTFGGIWDRAIKEKKTLFSNQGPFNTPKGHIPIKNTMVTPIIFRDEVISAIHIANKANDYDETDQVMLETLARHIAPVLYARLQADKQDKERKQAEEALRKREELHELFFSQSLDGFFYMMFDEPIRWDDTVDKEKVLDYVFTHHRITKVNDAMLQQYGASREQYIGLTPNDLYAHDIAYGRDVWRDFFDAGRLHLETDERKLDGTPIWIDGDYICLYDSQGRITGHFGVQREITEEKRAREALRESEQKYRALVEQSLQGIIILQDFQIVFANPTAAKIAGLTVDEVLALTGEDIKAFIPAEERAAILQRYEERLTDKPVEQNYELRLVRKNGDGFWLDVFVSRIEYLGKSAIQVAFIDITERKRAEEALRESKERLSAIVEKSPIPTAVGSSDGSIMSFNKALEELTGYKRTEINDVTDWANKLYPDQEYRDFVWKNIQQALRGEKQNCTEFTITHKDGSTRTVDFHTSFYKDGLIIQMVDITERKKAEQALRESQQSLVRAQQIAHIGDWDRDFVENTVKWSEELYRIFGVSPDDFEPTHKRFLNLVHPDDRELVSKITTNAASGKQPFSVDYRIVRPDGTECAVQSQGEVHTDNNGQVSRICGTVQDITERKKAEEALTESEENYHSIFDTANDAIFIHDLKDGTILDVNEKMLEMYGFANKKEIVGSFIGKLSSAKKLYTVEDAGKWIRKAIKEGPQLFEWHAKDKKGRLFWVEVNLKKAFIGGNDRILAIVRDITKRKKTEEQIAKLAKFPAENPNPVLRISGHGTVVYANKAGANLLKTWDCRVGKSVTDRWNELVMDALSSGQSQQTEVQCKGRIFSLTFAPVVKANYVNVYGLDITERKEAEKTLITYQNDLRSLASKLTSTEEFQRRQIAADLHDNVSQTLALSVNQLRRLRKAAASGEAKILDEICQMIEKSMQNVQDLTFDLASPTLYKIGLEAAISELLNEQLRDRHGIACKFSDDKKDKPLDDNIRVLLFQAVRELLINVIKHAKAHEVEVAIQRKEDKIQISVSDDGVGFDIQEAETSIERSGGFGLFNIRERTDYIDGSFEIHSQPGSGSRFILTAPIKTKTDLSPEGYDGS